MILVSGLYREIRRIEIHGDAYEYEQVRVMVVMVCRDWRELVT